jgi:poly(A) polymerase
VTEREFAREIVVRLRDAGFIAYWAGGCVRDLLLGLEPGDYDVATSAHPGQIRELFGHASTIPVGAAFGVIIVLSADRRMQVEVATFRTDASYSDGRHPDAVTFSTPEMDAQRRDFTINGLFYDPCAQHVLDYVDGQSDLRNAILRAIGEPDARISEDKLRLLRAIRFAARFDLSIEQQTYFAIKRHAAEASQVSGERLAMELQKSLETQRPAWAVRQWAETGLLSVLLPEIAPRWQLCQTQIELVLSVPGKSGWLARLASLLWITLGDQASAALLSIKERLKFSNDQVAALRLAIDSQTVLGRAPRLPWSQVQPLLISTWIETAVQLCALRINVGQVSTDTVAWLAERLAWPRERLDPPPLVTGQDLIKIGLRAGPEFKTKLEQIRALQLDGQLEDTAQALAWITK